MREKVVNFLYQHCRIYCCCTLRKNNIYSQFVLEYNIRSFIHEYSNFITGTKPIILTLQIRTIPIARYPRNVYHNTTMMQSRVQMDNILLCT
jgi:hypothetical protein